jgi:hypothetical protein
MTGRRGIEWLIVAVCALAVVGLIAYGRGSKHHRGDEIGSHGVKLHVVYITP